MRVTSLTVCIAVSCAAPALADAPVEPVRLAYTAPAGCPSRAEVESALAAKLGESALARPDQIARRFDIVIEPADAGFRARLRLVDRAGNQVERQVRSPTCAQAAEAIVLVAALAAKAQRVGEGPSGEAGGEKPGSAPSRGQEGAQAQEQEQNQRRELQTQAQQPEPEQEPEPERAVRRVPAAGRAEGEGKGEGEVALALGAATGVGPGVAPGLGLAARWSLGRTGPAFALGAGVYDSFRRETAAADARFRRWSGTVLACPFEPAFSDSVALSPCAGLELGAHTGRAYDDGESVVRARSQTLFFGQALVAVRLRLRLRGALVFELGPELGLPFTRNEFALRPDQAVYDVPGVTGAFRVAIGLNLQGFSGR